MVLVATELSWEQAMRLDSRNDDGKAGQGRIRAGVSGHVLSQAPKDSSSYQVEVAVSLH